MHPCKRQGQGCKGTPLHLAADGGWSMVKGCYPIQGSDGPVQEFAKRCNPWSVTNAHSCTFTKTKYCHENTHPVIFHCLFLFSGTSTTTRQTSYPGRGCLPDANHQQSALITRRQMDPLFTLKSGFGQGQIRKQALYGQHQRRRDGSTDGGHQRRRTGAARQMKQAPRSFL